MKNSPNTSNNRNSHFFWLNSVKIWKLCSFVNNFSEWDEGLFWIIIHFDLFIVVNQFFNLNWKFEKCLSMKNQLNILQGKFIYYSKMTDRFCLLLNYCIYCFCFLLSPAFLKFFFFFMLLFDNLKFFL